MFSAYTWPRYQVGVSRTIVPLVSFFDENHVGKYNSPKWDVAFCGVTSGLFYLPMSHKKNARLLWVKACHM